MKYLTVGTDEIKQDLFREVKDTDYVDSMKPNGGLWLTEYDESLKCNTWVDFMMARTNIWFYKMVGDNPFVQPCSVVSLKSNVNIYPLHNDQTLDYLMKCFPYREKFSYEELSKYYDGIYVNLHNLFLGKYDEKILKKFSSFGVSSLVLFNLDCINYYQSGHVFLEPFDYESGVDFPEKYEIKIGDTKKKILKK